MINEVHKNAFQDTAYARGVAQRIFDEGYVLLPDFLNQNTYDFFCKEVAEKSLQNKKGRELEGTLAWELGMSQEMLALFNAVYHGRCEVEGSEPHDLTQKEQRVGLPYKKASEETKKETPFHYDGAYLNAVLALQLPEGGVGDLYVYPNLRRYFGSGVLGKFVSRVLRHSALVRTIVPPKKVSYTENGLCLFFGDYTLHGVAPLEREGERLVMTINSHW